MSHKQLKQKTISAFCRKVPRLNCSSSLEGQVLQESLSTPGITHSTTCHEKGDVAFSKKIVSVNHFSEKQWYKGCRISVAWLKDHYPALDPLILTRERV